MSGQGDLTQRKRALRSRVRAVRDALTPEERARGSEAATTNLFALPEMNGASTVMTFWSFGSEIDTGPTIRRLTEQGRRVVLPKVEGRTIVAVGYRPGDPVTEASFGAMEPTDGDVLPPEAVDVVVAPGLAFDRLGYRVGYGGGFYDRFLRRTGSDAVTIGLCFAVQVVDEVPHRRGDRPMDLVVTDEGVIRCR
ncbi:MAG: 5-formyltetrahydrofolate cyclo-ligase [Actinomycetota bacterium]